MRRYREIFVALNDNQLKKERSTLIIDEEFSLLKEYAEKHGGWINFCYESTKSKTIHFLAHFKTEYMFYNRPPKIYKDDAVKWTIRGKTVFTKYEGLVDVINNNLRINFLALDHQHAFRHLNESEFVREMKEYIQNYRNFVFGISTILHVSTYHEDGFYLIFDPFNSDERKAGFYRIETFKDLQKAVLKEAMKQQYTYVFIVRNFSSISNIPFVPELKRNGNIKLAEIYPPVDRIFLANR